MIIYMAVELDEYELPYAIADSREELASILGVSKSAISVGLSQEKTGRQRSRYKKVEVEDEGTD